MMICSAATYFRAVVKWNDEKVISTSEPLYIVLTINRRLKTISWICPMKIPTWFVE